MKKVATYGNYTVYLKNGIYTINDLDTKYHHISDATDHAATMDQHEVDAPRIEAIIERVAQASSKFFKRDQAEAQIQNEIENQTKMGIHPFDISIG